MSLGTFFSRDSASTSNSISFVISHHLQLQTSGTSRARSMSVIATDQRFPSNSI